ncbi:NADH dehydrogenase [ubiquinone] 1 beta subcomplex subunit 8, mitochondrial [Lethenteron reissneri]|uniref:NADH dehydrogenase [ubiquinone] 1 beta subcomplex subunit 8, mitochondrial n=1 Tax=Lethenteron reissneri TaxID=7753 RepID=UPI002AB741D8|nr:NADH dehydrogenase [ubiquinone] 1 beta subcomplex subunit 8, mitochondrial [Lethenteron reissneri]
MATTSLSRCALRARLVSPRAGSLQRGVAAASASTSSKSQLPGPYPRTPEEVAAAARKYNMHPSDYKPYPDDGMGYGDYPQLPEKSQHEKDPSYHWDSADLRRNWGEPMHFEFDMYTRNRVDTTPLLVPWHTMCKQLFGFIGGMMLFFWLGNQFPLFRPVLPKQYPFTGLYEEKGGDPTKKPEAETPNYTI